MILRLIVRYFVNRAQMFWSQSQSLVNSLAVGLRGFVSFSVTDSGQFRRRFVRRRMRTPTNVLLVAMAVSDMLTGLSTMPAFIKFFTLGAYVDYMPYDWCVVAAQFPRN